MILIGFVIAIFFIVMICLIVRSYYKDIVELENRLLQLEKRISECEKIKKSWETLFDNANDLKGICIGFNYFERKEGESDMACGRKGRPVGRRTTSRGGGKRK